MRVIESPWAPTFREFIGSARHSLVLVAPFITAAPLRIVQESLHSSCLKRIDILTNFASSSLISRSCDPRALAKFASEVPPTRVFHLPGLHRRRQPSHCYVRQFDCKRPLLEHRNRIASNRAACSQRLSYPLGRASQPGCSTRCGSIEYPVRCRCGRRVAERGRH